jgi:hypothetical protein
MFEGACKLCCELVCHCPIRSDTGRGAVEDKNTVRMSALP